MISRTSKLYKRFFYNKPKGRYDELTLSFRYGEVMTEQGNKFLLFNEYREQIRAAYLTTEHNGLFDATKFSDLLYPIWKEATGSGVEDSEFEILVAEVLSKSEIHFPANKKAA